MARPRDGMKAVYVEMPVDLIAQIKESAKRNRRSMTGEIIIAIEKYLYEETVIGRSSNEGE